MNEANISPRAAINNSYFQHQLLINGLMVFICEMSNGEKTISTFNWFKLLVLCRTPRAGNRFKSFVRRAFMGRIQSTHRNQLIRPGHRQCNHHKMHFNIDVSVFNGNDWCSGQKSHVSIVFHWMWFSAILCFDYKLNIIESFNVKDLIPTFFTLWFKCLTLLIKPYGRSVVFHIAVFQVHVSTE